MNIIYSPSKNRFLKGIIWSLCDHEMFILSPPRVDIGGGKLVHLCLLSVSVQSVCLSSRFYHAGPRQANTRRWPNARLMFAHRLRRWANISPVSGYRAMFGVTLNVGQRHRRRDNINPALVQSIVLV